MARACGRFGTGVTPTAVNQAMSTSVADRAANHPPPPPRQPPSPASSDRTCSSVSRQHSGRFSRQHSGLLTQGSPQYSNGTNTYTPQPPPTHMLPAAYLPVQGQVLQQQQGQVQVRPPPPRYLPQQAPIMLAPVVYGPPIAPLALTAVVHPLPPPVPTNRVSTPSSTALQQPIVSISSRGAPVSIAQTNSNRTLPSVQPPPPPRQPTASAVSPAVQQPSAAGMGPSSPGPAASLPQHTVRPPPPPRSSVAAPSATPVAAQHVQVPVVPPAPPPRPSAGTSGGSLPAAANGAQHPPPPPPPAPARPQPSAPSVTADSNASHPYSQQTAPTAVDPPPPPPPRAAAPAPAPAAAPAGPPAAQHSNGSAVDVYGGPLAPWMLWSQQGLLRAVNELVADPQARYQLTGFVKRYGYGEWLLQQLIQQVRDLKQHVLQSVTEGLNAGGNEAVDSILELEDLISKAQAEGPPGAPPQLPGRPGYARSSSSSSAGTSQQRQQQSQQQQVGGSSSYAAASSNGRVYTAISGAGVTHRGVPAAGSSRVYAASNGHGHAAALAGGQTSLEDAADTRQQLSCVVCLDAPRSVLLLPCKHLVLCQKCAEELREKASTSREWRSVVRAQPVCPVCREAVTSHIQGVYL